MGDRDRLFTILQVSEKLKVPKHTLRFWEKELSGLMVPLRTRGGQRRYSAQNLLMLTEIKEFRETGLSLPQIAERINKVSGPGPAPPDRIDILASRVAEVVRSEVVNFFNREKENG